MKNASDLPTCVPDCLINRSLCRTLGRPDSTQLVS